MSKHSVQNRKQQNDFNNANVTEISFVPLPIHPSVHDSYSAAQMQELSSWRNPVQVPNSDFFYSQDNYLEFQDGCRDSLSSIWNRNSSNSTDINGDKIYSTPNFGTYAALEGGTTLQSSSTGQFAANLTGHFEAGSEIGMFGVDVIDYATYGHQQSYGYDSQYESEQCSNINSVTKPFSYTAVPGHEQCSTNVVEYQNQGEVQRRFEGISLRDSKEHDNKNIVLSDKNGYSSQSLPKKMSWANIASQPVKPNTLSSKVKKPGVLPPPVIMSSAASKSHPTPEEVSDIQSVHYSKTQRNYGETQLQQKASTYPRMPLDSIPPIVHQRQPLPPPFIPPHHRMPPPYLLRPPSLPNQVTNGDVKPVVEPISVLENLSEYNPCVMPVTKNARYFVIKSFSEDDIHRSIKYKIWCSTEHGNKRLDVAFQEQQGKDNEDETPGAPIFLLFSVNSSGHFCGVAEMLSGVDYSNSERGSVWLQDKFKGQFKVKWIYVKDVPNAYLRHIRLENNEGKPVTNSRDTQEVPPEKGLAVIKLIHEYSHTTSIFDDFNHYELRQEETEQRKQHYSQNQRAVAHSISNKGRTAGGHDNTRHKSTEFSGENTKYSRQSLYNRNNRRNDTKCS